MSKKDLILKNKKAVAGAALVALSGFVPTPLVQTARAATAKISVTGSLITGVMITAVKDLKFGKVAPTAANGKISVTTAGAYAGNVNGVGVAGKAQGKINFSAVSTVPKIDISVKGMGALVLGNTAGGETPVGTAKLSKVIFGFDTPVTVTAVGATGNKNGVSLAAADMTVNDMGVGGVITWGATQPLGSFGQTIQINMSF